eukprot:364397-Chlamydomonas_euryale.AAC.17
MDQPFPATSRWLVLCQAVCQQLFLPTLAFKATDFCQLLKDAIALPDLQLAAAAAAAPTAAVICVATSVMLLMRLPCGWIDCLDAFRSARPAKF